MKLNKYKNKSKEMKKVAVIAGIILAVGLIVVVVTYSLFQKEDESSLANGVVDQFCNECQIVFDANGGTNSTTTITVLNEGQYGTLPTPTKTNYDFDGWYTEVTGGDKITSETVVDLKDTQTLYAHWTPTNFSITYNLGGGSITGQKTSYTIESDTFSLPTPTKTNYIFLGWTGSNGSTANKNVSITNGSSGNKTYTANWKAATCIRATTLHTETCISSRPCTYSGYAVNSTVTYGNLGTKGTLTAGDAFDCNVDGTGYNQRFYYISKYFNTTTKAFENDTAVLVYYNNYATGIVYREYSEGLNNNTGSAKVLAKLPTTTQWSKVSLKNTSRQFLTELNTTSTSAGSLPVINHSGKAARLLTTQEIKQACPITTPLNTFYNGEIDTQNCRFLLENTEYTGVNSVTYYWLETPVSNESDMIWVVDIWNRTVRTDGVGNYRAVRPVIEVNIDDISY